MKIRKAVLTGGGRATRLRPITSTINKHLLPLANKPMIFHALEKVAGAGIEEVFINVNPGDSELERAVGDGRRWGLKITFFEQTGGPQGIAHVVGEARRFIGDEPFMFYLSDNILFGGVKELVAEFSQGNYDCLLALSKVSDPWRFGVPVFNADGQLVEVLEKPEKPPNNYAVAGIYLYGPKIYFEAFAKTQKSARGEYEISAVHTVLLKEGRRVAYKEITGWWKDTGKPEDLLVANRLLLAQLAPQERVQIGVGTVVGAAVEIFGPVLVGAGSHLENCKIGPNVTIGSEAKIVGATIRESILLDRVSILSPLRITNSLIGREVLINGGQENSREHRLIVGDKSVIEM